MKKTALLLGNGINAFSKGLTWEVLLDKMIQQYGDETIANKDKKKPFPLFYEEIFLAALRSGKISREEVLKEFIAREVSEFRPNPVHQLFRELRPAHIMTVNYEFLLEGTSEGLKNEGLIQETRYSIFRKTILDGTTFWHLHGDCLRPSSINLGYEHYCGQLQQMRNYVTSIPVYKSKKIRKFPMIQRLKLDGKLDPVQSWIDLFFTMDIHIIGMTLDFVEMDIWWLLSYRTRQVNSSMGDQIKNKIYYYIPGEYQLKAKDKLDLLRANEIEVRIVGDKHNQDYYERVAAQVK